MAIAGWQAMCVSLLIACLFSFAWSIRNFFVKPDSPTPGMQLTVGLGAVFAILHLGALLWPASVTTERGRYASVVYAASLCLFWSAIAANRAKPLSAIFASDVPVHLTRSGPYRLVRHPFYCSYLLAWIAGVVATGNWWLLSSVGIMLALYWRAARFEERKFLLSPLAAHYRDYQARTGQLFPNPWKMLTAGR